MSEQVKFTIAGTLDEKLWGAIEGLNDGLSDQFVIDMMNEDIQAALEGADFKIERVQR